MDTKSLHEDGPQKENVSITRLLLYEMWFMFGVTSWNDSTLTLILPIGFTTNLRIRAVPGWPVTCVADVWALCLFVWLLIHLVCVFDASLMTSWDVPLLHAVLCMLYDVSCAFGCDAIFFFLVFLVFFFELMSWCVWFSQKCGVPVVLSTLSFQLPFELYVDDCTLKFSRKEIFSL